MFIEQRSGIAGLGWVLRNAMGDWVFVNIFKYAPNWIYESAYALLGLEAREQVEAAKNRIAELEKEQGIACDQRDYAIQDIVKLKAKHESDLKAEQARSKALVEFAKKYESLFEGKGMGNEAGAALAAYENGAQPNE